MKTLQPVGNRVVVKVIEKDNRTESGIYLPDSSAQKHLHPNRDAIVVAVGPGTPLKDGGNAPMTVQVGDKVQINGICGVTAEGYTGKHARTEETIITEDDIYFIYEVKNENL